MGIAHVTARRRRCPLLVLLPFQGVRAVPVYPGRCPGLYAHWPFLLRCSTQASLGPSAGRSATKYAGNRTARKNVKRPDFPNLPDKRRLSSSKMIDDDASGHGDVHGVLRAPLGYFKAAVAKVDDFLVDALHLIAQDDGVASRRVGLEVMQHC